jgi:hypothetical protein
MDSGYLEDKEEYGRIILSWILGKYFVRMGGGPS